MTLRYEAVCKESQVPELMGQDVQITFSRRPAGAIDKSDPEELGEIFTILGFHGSPPRERTTVSLKAETPSDLSEESVNTFAIRNCLNILNRIIASYQATTGEVSNAGFIVPLGTSDMQLFAEIRVNGEDIRDRWPSHNICTAPLSRDQITEFEGYLTGQEDLPLSRLFLTNAILSLEQGQYPLAVLQAATAVELRLTQVIRKKLALREWPAEAIEPYERLTLGQKLRLPRTDPRSLKFHVGRVAGFSRLHNQVDQELTKLRNDVAHRGFLASHEEAKRAVEIARGFLRMVS